MGVINSQSVANYKVLSTIGITPINHWVIYLFITLDEMILDQPWCLNIKCTTTANKVLALMTNGHLSVAHKWVNTKLPKIYQKYIDDNIDMTTLKHMTPHWLNKSHLTSASLTYTDKLKMRTSYVWLQQWTKPNLIILPKHALSNALTSYSTQSLPHQHNCNCLLVPNPVQWPPTDCPDHASQPRHLFIKQNLNVSCTK